MPVVSSPAFAIRKRPEVVFTLDEYVAGGMMTEAQAGAIRAAADLSDEAGAAVLQGLHEECQSFCAEIAAGRA